jgi:hypothetical protein
MSSSTLAARQAVELGAERVENPCVAGVFAQMVVAEDVALIRRLTSSSAV